MIFTVSLIFDDKGRRELAVRCETLRQAAEAALQLADVHSHRTARPGGPRWVNVYGGERLELSVQVISGGLAAHGG